MRSLWFLFVLLPPSPTLRPTLHSALSRVRGEPTGEPSRGSGRRQLPCPPALPKGREPPVGLEDDTLALGDPGVRLVGTCSYARSAVGQAPIPWGRQGQQSFPLTPPSGIGACPTAEGVSEGVSEVMLGISPQFKI